MLLLGQLVGNLKRFTTVITNREGTKIRLCRVQVLMKETYFCQYCNSLKFILLVYISIVYNMNLFREQQSSCAMVFVLSVCRVVPERRSFHTAYRGRCPDGTEWYSGSILAASAHQEWADSAAVPGRKTWCNAPPHSKTAGLTHHQTAWKRTGLSLSEEELLILSDAFFQRNTVKVKSLV